MNNLNNKCFYCNTKAINKTSNPELKVCSCYRLQNLNGITTQYYKEEKDEYLHQIHMLENKITDLTTFISNLLYLLRTDMTSVTRYVKHNAKAHPTLSESEFAAQHTTYQTLAEDAVNNILKTLNDNEQLRKVINQK